MKQQQELFLYTSATSIKIERYWKDYSCLWVYKNKYHITQNITTKKRLEKAFNIIFTEEQYNNAVKNRVQAWQENTSKLPFLAVKKGDFTTINLSRGMEYDYNLILYAILTCYMQNELNIKPLYKKRLKKNLYLNKNNMFVINQQYKILNNDMNFPDFNHLDLLTILSGKTGFIECHPVLDPNIWKKDHSFLLRLDRFTKDYYDGKLPTNEETLKIFNKGREILKIPIDK
jgi:hypothetical protein